MTARHKSFADALVLTIQRGFEDQAVRFGADLHRRAVEARARDPLVASLLDTFYRQARERGLAAIEARRAGDRRRALELAQGCEIAADNARRVRAAIAGD